MKFTEEQVKLHKEFVTKLEEVSEYLKQNEPKQYALNNSTLSQLLSPLRHALVNRIKRITDVSERLYDSIEFDAPIDADKDEWNNVKRTNTIEAYEAFLENFDKSRFRSAATRKLNELKSQEV